MKAVKEYAALIEWAKTHAESEQCDNWGVIPDQNFCIGNTICPPCQLKIILVDLGVILEP